MATMKPMPSRASMFSLGTRQSVKTSSRVAEARMPIFFSFLPKVKPGVSFSTMKAVAPRAPLLAIGHGDDGVDLGFAAVGDPLFGAVEDVTVAVEDGGGLDPARVAAGVGLGQAEGRQPLARGDIRQEALLLFIGAEHEDGEGAQAGGRVADRHAAASPAEFLHHQNLSKTPPPRPPYSSGI